MIGKAPEQPARDRPDPVGVRDLRGDEYLLVGGGAAAVVHEPDAVGNQGPPGVTVANDQWRRKLKAKEPLGELRRLPTIVRRAKLNPSVVAMEPKLPA